MTTYFAWDPTDLGTVLSDGIDGSGTTIFAHSDGWGRIRSIINVTRAIVGEIDQSLFQ